MFKKKDKEAVSAEKKKKHIGRRILLVFFIIAAGLAAAYVVYASQFKTKFLEGTSINGVDVSGRTADEVENAIKKKVEGYSLTLLFADGKETVSGNAIGLTYTSDRETEKILDRQNRFAWAEGTFFGKTQEFTVAEAYTYDTDKLKTAIGNLPEMQDANVTLPADAHMIMDTDNRLSIVPEVEGTKLDVDKVYEAADEAVKAGESELNLAEGRAYYVEPAVRQDDKDLNLQVDDLNTFLNTTIVYQLYDGSTVTLDAGTTKDWLSVRDSDKDYYYFNIDVVKAACSRFVAQVAAQDDSVHTTTIFHSTNQGDREISCPEWGHKIDQTKEADALYDDLLNRKSETRKPIYAVDKPETSSLGTTFVEVDLANQHVYIHQNGSAVFDTACVTGLATDPTRVTPTGVFKIFMKQTNRDLKGPVNPATGKPTYISHVNYWMPFHNGVGLHDATWRSASEFGGDTYTYKGSHGCVNLPLDAARTIYSLVPVGTVVIVL
ncbi:MAG: L,D-transpeptidase family protein [Lachnospiraceae bacterium]|nr:L,D-transpeptidase family protein [Lachnospiraceae bacterium]